MQTQDVNEIKILSAIADFFDQTVETTREQILDAALSRSSTRDEVAFFLVEALAELLRREINVDQFADASTAYNRAQRFLDKEWNEEQEFKSATLVAIKRRLIETEWRCAKIPVDPLDLGVRFPEEKEFLKALTNQSVGTSKLDARLQTKYFIGKTAPPARHESEKLAFREEFVVGKHIRRGGQKDAYEIERTSAGQRLVLKELRPDLNVPDERETLRREANFQAKLSHPGVPLVVSLDDAPQNAEPPKFVEQFVPGGDWKSSLDRLSLDKNLNVLLQVAKILSFAHREKGIVHLDVKPENVMLGNYGEIFLVDWGMAQEIKEGAVAQRLGTPAYFAPEVVNGEPISAAVDVFALGGVLYKLLVGFAPYERAQSLLDALRLAKRCEFPPIPDSAPQDLRALAEKALAFNPQNRFADAGEFADALERVQRRAAVVARRDDAVKRRAELQDAFAQIDADSQTTAKEKRRRRARLADALVGNVNEFALARRAFLELADKEQDRADASDLRSENELLRAEFARAEIDARQYQLKQSLALGDFSQASALVDALRDLQTEEFALAPGGYAALYSEEYRRQSQAAVEEFDRAAQRGLAERRRSAALKAVSAALLGAVAVMLAWNLKTANERNTAQAQYAQEQAENLKTANEKNAALNALNKAQTEYAREQASNIFNGYDVVAKQAIRDRVPQQAIVAYFQAAQEISNENDATKDIARQARALMETTAQTSLLLQRESSFTPNVAQTSFSSNGDAFATLDTVGNLIAWNANDLTTDAWRRVDAPDNLHLRANPLYKSKDAEKPEEAAPFLTVNSKGEVRLFGAKKDSYDLLLDAFRDDPDDLEVSCRPVVSQPDDPEPLLFVPTSRGEVWTINLATRQIVEKANFDESFARVEVAKDRIVARIKSGALITRTLKGKDVKELTLDATKEQRDDLFNFALSPDGAQLALSFNSGDAYILDLATDKRRASFPKSKITKYPVAFIQYFFWTDAKNELLSLGANNELCLWKIDDAGQATVLRTLDGEQDGDAYGWGAYAYSSATNKLATFGNDFTLRISDVASGKVVAKSSGLIPQNMNSFTVSDVAYNPTNDRFIVAAYGPHGLVSFDGNTLKQKTEYDAFWDYNNTVVATFLAVRPNSDEFAAAFDDGSLAIYNGDDTKPRKKLDRAFGDAVPIAKGSLLNNPPIVAVSGNGNIVGATMKGKDVILWDWELNEIKRFESKFDDGKYRIGLTFVDDDLLLETVAPNLIRIWNLETRTIERETRVDNIKQADFVAPKFFSAPPTLSNDRKTIAVGFSNGEFLTLDASDFHVKQRATLPDLRARLKIGVNDFKPQNYGDVQAQAVTGLAWSADDQMLVVGSSDAVSSVVMLRQDDKLTFLTSFVAGVEPNQTNVLNQFRCNVFFTRNNEFVGVTTDGVMRAWDFEPNDADGVEVASLSGADAVATTRDGRARLCLRRESLPPKLCSFVDEQEKWLVPNVKEFRLWLAPDGKERCLALDKDGKLLTLDLEMGNPTTAPFDLTQGCPKNGFRNIEISPDGKTLAGIDAASKNVFVFDLNGASAKWTPILSSGNKDDVYQVNFSADSSILGVATQLGDFSEIRLWDVQQGYFLTPEGGDALKASKNVALNANCGKLRFIDERFAVYTGFGKDVSVFDVKKRNLHQRIEAPIVSEISEDLYVVAAVASLKQGIGREKQPAFVVGGPDGILRFYQYSPERELFENVWNISWLKFDRIIETKQNSNALQGDESSTESDDIDLSDFDIDLDDNDEPHYQIRAVNDLYVSPDGKTLYVSSLKSVRAYDLEKIWRKIETVGQNWDADRVERATGLRMTPSGAVETTLRNSLLRVGE